MRFFSPPLLAFDDCPLNDLLLFNPFNVRHVLGVKLSATGARLIGSIVIRGRWPDWSEWQRNWSSGSFGCPFRPSSLRAVADKCGVPDVGLTVVFDEWNEWLKPWLTTYKLASLGMGKKLNTHRCSEAMLIYSLKSLACHIGMNWNMTHRLGWCKRKTT